MSSRTALAVWDFTLSVRKSTDDHKLLIKELPLLAKKWCFQLEDSSLAPDDVPYNSDDDGYTDSDNCNYNTDSSESYESDLTDLDYNDSTDYGSSCSSASETSDSESDSDSQYSSDDEDEGYVHWQGRISLHKRKRLQDLRALCNANELLMSRAHWSPTSCAGRGQVFYTMKLDTRVDGPWCDTDEPEIEMPKQLAHITKLRPFQQEIIDRSLHIYNSRVIHWLYDETGNSGKSSLVLWCKVNKIMNCRIIPCLLSSSFGDLNAAVMDQPVGELYFIDMPRALPKAKLHDLMAFLETCKTGYVYDKRYHFRERVFSSPQVWVMSNALPDKKMLSNDRLITWTIKDDELVLWPSLKKAKPVVYPEQKELMKEFFQYLRVMVAHNVETTATTDGGCVVDDPPDQTPAES